MDFKIEISKIVNEEHWNSDLIKNRSATVYQIPQWSDIYKESYNSKPFFISIKNSKNETVGQLSIIIHDDIFWINSNVFSKNLGTKMKLRTVLNWFYGPIIHNEEKYQEILSLILDAIDIISKENNVTMIRGSLPPQIKKDSDQEFFEHKYEKQKWATYLTKIEQNEEEFYKKLKKNTRYDIRKSDKNELEFVIADDVSLAIEFSKLKDISRKENGEKSSINKKFIEKRWKSLNENNFAKLFVAKHKGNVVAGVYCLVFNGNVIQHSVVNSQKNLEAGTFLTWNIIKWCIKNEMKTFDVAGVNPLPINEKEKQIDYYKSKWNSEKNDYSIYEKILNKRKIKMASLLKNPKKIFTKITN